MIHKSQMEPKAARNLVVFLVLLLVAVMWLKLGAMLVTILFSCFVIEALSVLKRKWLILTVFIALVLVLAFGLGFGLERAFHTIPKVAETSIPGILNYAKAHGFDLPFTDWQSLKELAMENVKDEYSRVSTFANVALKQLVLTVIGIVTAIGLFLNPTFGARADATLYSSVTEKLREYFRSFYLSFRMVMGAQIIISGINTCLTALFIFTIGLPYASMVVVLTFLCGMLPIVGNLISNTIIVCIAFTVSPQLALWSLIFLIVLHKLEYFLNSKIIGNRIKNPVWLTLLALVIGERLLGLTGMILAPVVLHFLKTKASEVAVGRPSQESESRRADAVETS